MAPMATPLPNGGMTVGSKPTSLDYTAVLAVIDFEIDDPNVNRRELFEQLRLIERGALLAWSER